MAGALFPAFRARAAARVRLLPDGSAEVASATHDLGTGMSTIMCQTAAEVLGLPIERVRSYLGDSSLPDAPVAGGSLSTASVLPAVQEAARRALACLVTFATGDRRSPVAGLRPEEVVFQDGRLAARSDPARGETLAALCQRQRRPAVEATAESAPGEDGEEGDEDDRWELYSFGAHFVEVGVHEWTAEVRVRRVVSVMDVGRVINPLTARSQVAGGVVWGIGMALTEESRLDPKTARVVTASLADYRVPVHADVPEIEVHFIDEPDLRCNPLGARGVGEIGTTGVAAAIANAVYHATGRRMRDLPITPDKLL
jgi:xanthine dehydrogenase YagR molybdenum-binding subunit